MSAPRTYESELLADTEKLVAAFVDKYPRKGREARFQLLEAAAARLGGFKLEDFQSLFGITAIAPSDELLQVSSGIVDSLRCLQIQPALALSALSRESLDANSRRTTGAYHTDFRLALRLAKLASAKYRRSIKVIDPACGAGMLLVAVTIEACGPDRRKTARWLAESVYAADLSPAALRGCLLSLAALTSDLDALGAMRSKWFVGDSLMAAQDTWNVMAPQGFDIVIGNPPWEKVKLTRHEFLRANGAERHYGAETEAFNQKAFARQRDGVSNYARALVQLYPMLGRGEPDLYIAFTELFEKLCKPGGTMAVLVPGGLIRSQGTEAMRRHLLDVSDQVSISVVENRARFFSIDTRFKFLAVACTKSTGRNQSRRPLTLRHEKGTTNGVEAIGNAVISRKSLMAVRPDLSLPEVRSNDEWRVFQKMIGAGVDWTDRLAGWRAEFCREVDMTRERKLFRLKTDRSALPLIEGRMVQQYRFGAKGHVAGTGRRAIWEKFSLGQARTAPQFRISLRDVPASARARANRPRCGFCDITGQTNERSMMAAIIPPGVVCGNKVPTVLFPGDPSEERLLVWCAVMNSFAFDWMLRRIMTTTVNYFLLTSLPMPPVIRDGLPWRRIVSAVEALRALDRNGNTKAVLERASALRAEIDVAVASAYGLGFHDLELIIEDFPLLDRGQPALPGEQRSTVTRDTFLAAAAKRFRVNSDFWTRRLHDAQSLGAVAYVPSEFTHRGFSDEEERVYGKS